MGDKTGIEWTDATWNPIVGCSIVSPGCTNCYAMKMAGRLINGDRASLTFAEAALIYVDDGHRDLYLAPLIRHFRDQPVAAITAGHIRAAARVLYPEARPATWNRQVITPARAIINHAAGRRGFATAMARAGVDAKTAAVRGGWRSVRLMLDIYTEANTTEGLIAEVFGTFESQCRAGFVPGRLRLTQVSLCPIYRT